MVLLLKNRLEITILLFAMKDKGASVEMYETKAVKS